MRIFEVIRLIYVFLWKIYFHWKIIFFVTCTLVIRFLSHFLNKYSDEESDSQIFFRRTSLKIYFMIFTEDSSRSPPSFCTNLLSKVGNKFSPLVNEIILFLNIFPLEIHVIFKHALRYKIVRRKYIFWWKSGSQVFAVEEKWLTRNI